MSDEPPEKRPLRGEPPPRSESLPDYRPIYDEEALNRFAEKGAVAWAAVPDAVRWVREIRGAADGE